VTSSLSGFGTPRMPTSKSPNRFLEAAEDTLSLLATQPESGNRFFVRKPEQQGIRRFPVSAGFEQILLFYFPLPDGVDLVRVVQAAAT
jgi:hypothetical protein